MFRAIISACTFSVLSLSLVLACDTGDAAEPAIPVVPISTAALPPEWAIWERHVLEQLHPALLTFVDKYTREDGTLIWRDEWPGFDGSDDGYESFYNFPLYYALGGPQSIDPLARKLWDGVTRQFTGYGQVYDEFDAHYDWMHHGESYTNFYMFGLMDPNDSTFRERAVRFAALYTGENPDAPNFDPAKWLIRSPITGSRGPHFVNTAEDWVTHRPILAHYPLPFDDIPHVNSSAAWNDDELFPHILDAINERMMRGDVPLNLTSTSLMLNAYLTTGDDKYKQWIEDYVQAWMDRVADNDGILPDNVGLSGKVGEHMDGKWWGGYYGWRWPHGLFNQLESTIIGASNAYVVSGDARYLGLPRSVIDLVAKEGKTVDGILHVPHRHGDDGWYDYRPINSKYLVHLWYLSRADEDWQRIERLAAPSAWDELSYSKGKGDSENPEQWLAFVRGRNDEYPVQVLQACFGETMKRLDDIAKDQTTPDQQDVHHWQNLNPVVLEGLVQLMLGGPNHIYHGGMLSTSVRYFDPAGRRSGLPPDVAALVDRLTPSGVRIWLVNLHASEPREVILQAGMFGEHNFTRVRKIDHYPYQFNTINGKTFRVSLVPGAVGQLEVGLDRFVNQPSYAFPEMDE
ncbi:MAG: hypothetical protein KDA86_19605 [Planctomycetaceae bacterium]|nr:hypothetical protein [Planctomycetaceae bacterium]